MCILSRLLFLALSLGTITYYHIFGRKTIDKLHKIVGLKLCKAPVETNSVRCGPQRTAEPKVKNNRAAMP